MKETSKNNTECAGFEFSVIIAHTRSSIRDTLISLANQTIPHELFEVIVIGDKNGHLDGLSLPFKNSYIECAELNPSVRRNLGVEQAAGKILAFIDDDATASEGWLLAAKNAFDQNNRLKILGGPTYLPDGANFSEQLTYKLAHCGFFGNGHENLSADTDDPDKLLGYITCCNMFIHRTRLSSLCDFDFNLGYGGEDTLLIYRLTRAEPQAAFYSLAVSVYHSRGEFSYRFLATRLKYRINNGLMLWAEPSIYLGNAKFSKALIAGVMLLIIVLIKPAALLSVIIVHQFLSLIYASRYFGDDPRMTFAFPPAQILQHSVYAIGIIIGLLSILTPAGKRKIENIRAELK